MKYSPLQYVKQHYDAHGIIAMLSTLLFILFMIVLYAKFIHSAEQIDAKTESNSVLTQAEIDAVLRFTALEDNPKFGLFQLGASLTDEKLSVFQQHYTDMHNNTVDISFTESDIDFFIDKTMSLSSDIHPIYENVDLLFHVQFKDNQLVYIKHTFLYETSNTCEASFEQFSQALVSQYGELKTITPTNTIKFYSSYQNTYAESDIINDKFAVSIEHDCSKEVKDINVRLGYLPKVVNAKNMEELRQFNASYIH